MSASDATKSTSASSEHSTFVPDSDSGSVTSGSVMTRHRASINRINTDVNVRIRHKVPEPSPSTLRRWKAPSTRRPAAATIHEDEPLPSGERNFDDDDGETGGERWAEQMRATFFGEKRSSKQWLHTLLPMSAWLSTYKWKSYLQTDVLAGLTVGVMIIPQSMSYAKLAGLPVEFGLYSSLVPIYAYAFFGSSRQLAIGPVAIVSLF